MGKKIVIVDIDGTICQMGEDRLKVLHEKPIDYEKFYSCSFDDNPILEIVELVEKLSQMYRIIFCTSRQERVRNATTKWIERHFSYASVEHPEILMRSNGDYRHDTVVKPELLFQYLTNSEAEDILMVLEDRSCMVAKWRQLGLVCLQVAEGDF